VVQQTGGSSVNNSKPPKKNGSPNEPVPPVNVPQISSSSTGSEPRIARWRLSPLPSPEVAQQYQQMTDYTNQKRYTLRLSRYTAEGIDQDVHEGVSRDEAVELLRSHLEVVAEALEKNLANLQAVSEEDKETHKKMSVENNETLNLSNQAWNSLSKDNIDDAQQYSNSA
jgi:hypothetical protein